MSSESLDVMPGKSRKRPATKLATRNSASKVKATIHLSVEASQRLSVHAAMLGMDRSELVVEAHLPPTFVASLLVIVAVQGRPQPKQRHEDRQKAAIGDQREPIQKPRYPSLLLSPRSPAGGGGGNKSENGSVATFRFKQTGSFRPPLDHGRNEPELTARGA